MKQNHEIEELRTAYSAIINTMEKNQNHNTHQKTHSAITEDRLKNLVDSWESKLDLKLSKILTDSTNKPNAAAKQTNRNSKDFTGKQYKFYCCSHGVKISHDSKDCTSPKAGHNPTCTFITCTNFPSSSKRHLDKWIQMWEKPAPRT